MHESGTRRARKARRRPSTGSCWSGWSCTREPSKPLLSHNLSRVSNKTALSKIGNCFLVPSIAFAVALTLDRFYYLPKVGIPSTLRLRAGFAFHGRDIQVCSFAAPELNFTCTWIYVIKSILRINSTMLSLSLIMVHTVEAVPARIQVGGTTVCCVCVAF